MTFHIEFERALLGHRAAVYTLMEGAMPANFISGGGDGWISQWSYDSEDGRLIATTGTPVVSLCWLILGELLAAGTLDGKLHFIRIHSQDETRVFDLGGKSSVFALQFDGEQLWVGDGTGRITLWDPKGELLTSEKLAEGPIRVIKPEGPDHFLIGCSDANVYRFHKEGMAVMQSWKAHDPSVFAIAQDPMDGSFWTGGRDAMLRHWVITEGLPVLDKELAAHWFTINAIAFHPTERIFATASRDKRVRLWTASGELLQSIDPATSHAHVNSVNALRWTRDGKRLISASDDRSIRTWLLNK